MLLNIWIFFWELFENHVIHKRQIWLISLLFALHSFNFDSELINNEVIIIFDLVKKFTYCLVIITGEQLFDNLS